MSLEGSGGTDDKSETSIRYRVKITPDFDLEELRRIIREEVDSALDKRISKEGAPRKRRPAPPDPSKNSGRRGRKLTGLPDDLAGMVSDVVGGLDTGPSGPPVEQAIPDVTTIPGEREARGFDDEGHALPFGGAGGLSEENIVTAEKGKTLRGGTGSRATTQDREKGAFVHKTFQQEMKARDKAARKAAADARRAARDEIRRYNTSPQGFFLQRAWANLKYHLGTSGGRLINNPATFVAHQAFAYLGNAPAFFPDNRMAQLGGNIFMGLVAGSAIYAVTSKVIEELRKKGMPLNVDYFRDFENDSNALWSVEDKKRRLMGQDTYVITQVDKYQPESGATTYNSLENREEIIVARSGLAEQAVGIRYG